MMTVAPTVPTVTPSRYCGKPTTLPAMAAIVYQQGILKLRLDYRNSIILNNT